MRPGVIFDLDGTLIDSNYLHTLAWSRALEDCGEWAPSNAIHRLVGMGGDQLLPELLGRDLPAASDRRATRYKELIEEVRPFPGAEVLLRLLRSEGLAVVLATSSPDEELERLLPLVGGRDRFDAVTSAGDVAASKPAPDVFEAAVRSASLDASRAVVVGDSVWDIHAARAAGLACIGVETGGFSRHELAESGALAVYRDVAELSAQWRTSPIGGLRP
ncbi:HAD family hydrolase [Acidiferrimicrobium sp. IK]|uniref:HAD family hydrolase n=1 Tax=Acidiferrimicrobium sp. IK TaxID=2871700 RepID=UPI0021CB99E0|nr:HAD family hydrolase [Acidiferrimicrobium sp. IK]MCU4185407.1 HAD family hydrolase [Acidiferrimicrobium sp. IK]